MLTQQTLLDRLETELREILEMARTQIAPLPLEALLFRPAPDRPKARESWNILECLAHVNAFSENYFSRIDLAIHKAKARKWLATNDAPVKYSGRGRRAIRRADLDNGKWLKSPKVYNFFEKQLGNEVVKTFIINAERLLRTIQIARDVDLNRPKVRKAHAWTGNYPLGNLLEYLVTHQRRHLRQVLAIIQKSAH
ncbi:MAG: DinB family protein [Saprospiraceae bacterium]